MIQSSTRMVYLAPAIALVILVSTLFSCGRTFHTARRPALRVEAANRNILVGAAARSAYLSEHSYAKILGAEFNQLEPENELKFAIIHPSQNLFDFRGGDDLVAFGQAHNMKVRGHTLVWHRQLPPWIATGKLTSSQLKDVLKDHIARVMSHYAGKIYAWDVVNEAFNDDGTLRSTVWYDQPGTGHRQEGTAYIEEALRWARDADPQAKLFYNDYGAEQINPKSDAIYKMAKDFKERGVALDGVGFQFHESASFDNPRSLASVRENFRRFAALGLELQVTELDVRLTDATPESLKKQAKIYSEITNLCLTQPACTAIQTWGFTDKHSWIPYFFPGTGWALLWNSDYREKPAYQALSETLR